MTPKQRRQERRRRLAVRVGVFVMVFAGVIGQHVVESMDAGELEIVFDLTTLTVPKLLFAALFAALAYRRLNGKGDLEAMIKKRENVDRALGLGLGAGWLVSDIVGKVAEVLS